MRRLTICILAAFAMMVAACNPTGPDPTVASIEAETGPYPMASVTVAASEVSTFGGATIYHPTDPGSYAALAIAPGFNSTQPGMAWFGPRLASHGFVVINIDTLSRLNNADQRGAQLLAALDYLTEESAVAGMVNPNRTAVMGWSMGGGGALAAALERGTLRAAIPLAPYINTNQDWSAMTVPTMMITCENDQIAPKATQSDIHYGSLPAGLAKANIDIANDDHYCVTGGGSSPAQETAIARSVISFLNRFANYDTRYDQFLCPPPALSVVSSYQANCPY